MSLRLILDTVIVIAVFFAVAMMIFSLDQYLTLGYIDNNAAGLTIAGLSVVALIISNP